MEPDYTALQNELAGMRGRLPSYCETWALLRAPMPGQAAWIWKLLDVIADPAARRWRERLVAIAAMTRLPLSPEHRRAFAETLSAILTNELPGDDRDQRERRCMLWAVVIALAGGGVFLFVHSLLPSILVVGVLLYLLVALLPPLRAALIDWEDHRINRVRLAAATALGFLSDPIAVGALAAALHDRNARLRRAAGEALRETLPFLTPEHYGTLGPGAVPGLCHALFAHDTLLMVLALEALEKVGDARAIRSVKSVIQHPPNGEVLNAALKTMEALEMRLRRETAPLILLRPADPPGE